MQDPLARDQLDAWEQWATSGQVIMTKNIADPTTNLLAVVVP